MCPEDAGGKVGEFLKLKQNLQMPKFLNYLIMASTVAAAVVVFVFYYESLSKFKCHEHTSPFNETTRVCAADISSGFMTYRGNKGSVSNYTTFEYIPFSSIDYQDFLVNGTIAVALDPTDTIEFWAISTVTGEDVKLYITRIPLIVGQPLEEDYKNNYIDCTISTELGVGFQVERNNNPQYFNVDFGEDGVRQSEIDQPNPVQVVNYQNIKLVSRAYTYNRRAPGQAPSSFDNAMSMITASNNSQYQEQVSQCALELQRYLYALPEVTCQVCERRSELDLVITAIGITVPIVQLVMHTARQVGLYLCFLASPGKMKELIAEKRKDLEKALKEKADETKGEFGMVEIKRGNDEHV